MYRILKNEEFDNNHRGVAHKMSDREQHKGALILK